MGDREGSSHLKPAGHFKHTVAEAGEYYPNWHCSILPSSHANPRMKANTTSGTISGRDGKQHGSHEEHTQRKLTNSKHQSFIFIFIAFYSQSNCVRLSLTLASHSLHLPYKSLSMLHFFCTLSNSLLISYFFSFSSKSPIKSFVVLSSS